MFESSQDPMELFRVLDLTDESKVSFDNLSGSLKQRIGIAATPVNNPELVFLEEPTNGSDQKSRRDVWSAIRNVKKSGKTVILTSHRM